MTKKYFRITPLEKGKTYITHNIISSSGRERRWVATQVIGSQLGYRYFENPIEQHEVDDDLIYSDPKLSGYQFDDGFDFISTYEYWFDDSFGDEEKALLINQYEGGSDAGMGAAWLEIDQSWKLEGEEELRFECSILIDLIDQNGDLLEKDIKPTQ